MTPQHERLWASDATGMDTSQVPHLFLSPSSDHFTRITSTVSITKAKLSAHIFVSIFEGQDTGFVDFDGSIQSFFRPCMINICFFSSTDTTINRFNHFLVYHLEKDHSCFGIQYLFNRRSVLFIFDSGVSLFLLRLQSTDLIGNFRHVLLQYNSSLKLF